MHKFFRRLILLSACVFLCAGLADYTISYRATLNDNRLTTPWREILCGEAAADILICGNSIPMAGADPSILDSICGVSAYNLGISGRQISSQVLKYTTYIRHNPKPRLIIQSIDKFGLCLTGGAEPMQYYPLFWDKGFREDASAFEHFAFRFSPEIYTPIQI